MNAKSLNQEATAKAAKTEFPPRYLTSEKEAFELMRIRNRAAKSAGNRRDFFVVVDGPKENFLLTSLRHAIEIGNGYRWEVA